MTFVQVHEDSYTNHNFKFCFVFIITYVLINHVVNSISSGEEFLAICPSFKDSQDADSGSV